MDYVCIEIITADGGGLSPQVGRQGHRHHYRLRSTDATGDESAAGRCESKGRIVHEPLPLMGEGKRKAVCRDSGATDRAGAEATTETGDKQDVKEETRHHPRP